MRPPHTVMWWYSWSWSGHGSHAVQPSAVRRMRWLPAQPWRLISIQSSWMTSELMAVPWVIVPTSVQLWAWSVVT